MLQHLSIEQFRCIESAELALPAGATAIIGPNGAGKTSLLEAAYFLSRGRSFRQSRTDRLIRHGEPAFRLRGTIEWQHRNHAVGVEASRGQGNRIRIDGKDATSLTPVATALAVQVLEPEVHLLVSGGPEHRRNYLDYGVFHVEPGYLTAWRRYRTLLRQRTAALKRDVGEPELEIWDQQLGESAEIVDGYRRGYVNLMAEPVTRMAARLGLESVSLEYRPGWADAPDVTAALAANRAADRERGVTSVGPHRADLSVRWSGRLARPTVSRGQQKLLGAALLLAQARLLAQVKEDAAILLLDDPGAELDPNALNALLATIRDIPGQHIVAALDDRVVDALGCSAVFHVKHGVFVTA